MALCLWSTSHLDEVGLQVVTVQFGSAKDESFVHLELLDRSNTVLGLESFDGLGEHFFQPISFKITAVKAETMSGPWVAHLWTRCGS